MVNDWNYSIQILTSFLLQCKDVKMKIYETKFQQFLPAVALPMLRTHLPLGAGATGLFEIAGPRLSVSSTPTTKSTRH
jgi:hypothetical protein